MTRELLLIAASPALSLVVKATLVMVLAFAGAQLARRRSAGVRHALLASLFAALLLLPLVSLVAPPFAVQVNAPRPAASIGVATFRTTVTARATRARAAPAESPRSAPSASTLLVAGWTVGAALFLLPVLAGLWQVRSLRRNALPWRAGQAIAEDLAREAGIRRKIAVLLHSDLSGPFTCGAFKPAIILPADAETWTPDDLARALVHELEHVRRRDSLSHGLARAICSVYWFHPLVWMAWRRLVLEAERSCDDAVLRRFEPTAYADQLVALARRLSGSSRQPLLAMANRADLAARIAGLLDSRQGRGRAGMLPVATACAAAALCVLTVAPLRVVAAPQAAPQNPAQSTAQFRTSSLLVVLPVEVSDFGRPVPGLKASDFTVTEDGVTQVIQFFDTPSDLPGYYVIGYYTRNQRVDDQFRAIQVTLKNLPTVTVKTRPGYYRRITTTTNEQPRAAGPAANPGSTAPVLLYKVEPEYSDEARRAKYQGTVTLSVDIDENGLPNGVHVVRSLGLGLDEKAIEAVRKWVFKPATQNGAPVATTVQLWVDFRLL
jgi:TonB family protein